jgi:hypothetical protein
MFWSPCLPAAYNALAIEQRIVEGDRYVSTLIMQTVKVAVNYHSGNPLVARY